MKKITVAIDGPAGAGKSSVAKELARRLGCVYIDTGAMYRAIGVCALERGIDTKDEAALCEMLKKIKMEVTLKEDGQHILISNEDYNGKIRTPEASMAASAVATVPAVRLWLVEIQREIAEKTSVVMDGRDIGTYVLPNADLKLFLTASIEERAKRRYLELCEKGESVTKEEVISDMKKRDEQDTNRAFAPLRAAEDSILVDSTGCTLLESVEKILKIIEERKVK